jgi:hypothetical protein
MHIGRGLYLINCENTKKQVEFLLIIIIIIFNTFLLLFDNRISCDIEDFVFLIEARFSNGTSIDIGVIGAKDSVKIPPLWNLFLISQSY